MARGFAWVIVLLIAGAAGVVVYDCRTGWHLWQAQAHWIILAAVGAAALAGVVTSIQEGP